MRLTGKQKSLKVYVIHRLTDFSLSATYLFPKFSDSQVCADSVDPGQTSTAPTGAVCSRSAWFTIPSASFKGITVYAKLDDYIIFRGKYFGIC